MTRRDRAVTPSGRRVFHRGVEDGDPGGLLERDVELAGIRLLLGRLLDGGGGTAVLEAPPGLGKTALLRWTAGTARAAGLQVGQARGSELEQEFAFGVVRQLFASLSVQAGDPEAPLDSASAAVLAGAGAVPASLFTVLSSLTRLLAGLAARGPVVLLVDDAQWADLPSLQLLDFLGRRVEELPVLVLVTARAGHPGPAGLLDGLVAQASARFEPRVLSERAVAAAVREQLADGADEAFVRACHAATGGNPLFVRELLRSLAAEGTAPSAASVPAVLQARPGGITRHVRARRQHLGPEAQRLATCLALLGDGTDLATGAGLAGLDDDRAAEAADALVAQGILEQVSPPAFVHALVRDALLQLLSPSELGREHDRAAGLLAARGAAPERVASHVLLTAPQRRADRVGVLVAAADEARRRGTPTASVVYLRRALAEPPPVEQLSEISRTLGNCEAYGLQFEQAERELRTAVDAAQDPGQRALASFSLSRLQNARGDADEALQTLLQVDDAPPVHPLLAVRVQAELAGFARVAMRQPLAAERLAGLQSRRQEAERLWPPLRDVLEAHASLTLLQEGGAAPPAAALAERSLAAGRLRPDGSALYVAVQVLLSTDRLAVAEQHLEQAMAHADENGLLVPVAMTRAYLARAALLRGDLAGARAHVAAGLAVTNSRHFARPLLHATQVHLLLARGELSEAGGVLSGSVLPGSSAPRSVLHYWLLEARASWRAATGDLEGALGDFQLGLQLYEDTGWERLVDVPWLLGAGRTAAALGRRELAARLLAQHQQCAADLGTPRAVAAGLHEFARQAGRWEGLAPAAEAVRLLQDSPARLELAQALATQGGLLAERGERAAARLALRQALELAVDCSADLLVDQLRSVLALGGGRPPRQRLSGEQALTPAERQVAQLAAGNLTNRQIAEQLVVSSKTVEAHLRRAFRKLDVTSRTQLNARLAPPHLVPDGDA